MVASETNCTFGDITPSMSFTPWMSAFRLVSDMEAVRSVTTTTFIGLGAISPHDPVHATATCEPVEPSSTPIAGAKLKGTSCSAPIRMVLQVIGNELATELPGFQLLAGLARSAQGTAHRVLLQLILKTRPS